MRKCLFIILLFIVQSAVAQDDTAVTKLMNSMEVKPEKKSTPVFYAQRLINMNTVEVLHKGILEFKVVHNFGDVAGKNGSLKNFFGLDAANDIKIALQLGLTNKLNVLLARTRGDYHAQAKLVETGIKYQFMKQADGDKKQPVSITLFANLAISTMAADTFNNIFAVNTKDDRFQNFGDRTNEVVQLMIARRFGKFSFQLTPTWVHTGLVVPNDPASLFSIGAGARLPVTRKFVLVADYFHTFRSSSSKSTLEQQFTTYGNPNESNYYDVLGIGVEILTPGHMFHLNFTNATSILEDRFLRRTYSTWSKGQFHWGFTVARNFSVFRDKKAK
ncbi:MAG: hypothetical protein JST86_02075 [Bacteroidetes bacterium]|nr:hypothetical protein [Bacteroidota bacterium]